MSWYKTSKPGDDRLQRRAVCRQPGTSVHGRIIVGVSGLVVECRTRNFQVLGSNLTAVHLQATLSKLLTYGVLKSTQPPTLRGTGNE